MLKTETNVNRFRNTYKVREQNIENYKNSVLAFTYLYTYFIYLKINNRKSFLTC